MREMGVRGVLVYCADYRCSHSVALSADRWPDDLQMTLRLPTSNRSSPATRAAGMVAMSGPTSTGANRPVPAMGVSIAAAKAAPALGVPAAAAGGSVMKPYRSVSRW
jgi:hypothetical protein